MFKKKKGKTYVISDIHSHLDVLDEFLNDINPEDKVYFLGDACDKGPDGVKTLQRIMQDLRIVMIMGNHDLMFLDWYNWSKKEEIESSEDNLDFTTRFFNSRARDLWLDYNYGEPTMESFLELSEQEQKEMISYLKSLPLALSVEVIDSNTKKPRKFLLAHSVPYYIPEYLPGAIMYEGNETTAECFLWDRQHFIHEEGYIIITGHTQTFSLRNPAKVEDFNFDIYHYPNDKDPYWIDIDCGLASNYPGCKLCALCLDDMSFKYYTPENLIKL